MSVLGVTLARGGSKGVPRKHLRPIGGRPLLEWTLDAARQCRALDDYVFSSDDDELLALADGAGIDTIHRPAHLAQDDTPTLPALIHAVQMAESRFGMRYQYIAEIRATSPFKTADDIDRMVNLLVSSGADSVIGVTPLEDHHPARGKWLTDDGYLRDFVDEPVDGRRQDLTPRAYVRNGTVYALRREWVMGETPKLFGHEKSLAYVMPAERSLNIDDEMDVIVAQVLAETLLGARVTYAHGRNETGLGETPHLSSKTMFVIRCAACHTGLCKAVTVAKAERGPNLMLVEPCPTCQNAAREGRALTSTPFLNLRDDFSLTDRKTV